MRVRVVSAAFAFVVALAAGPSMASTCGATAGTVCPKVQCDTLGLTKLSDDKASLVICVATTGSMETTPSCGTAGAPNGNCLWKGLSDGGDPPKGTLCGLGVVRNQYGQGQTTVIDDCNGVMYLSNYNLACGSGYTLRQLSSVYLPVPGQFGGAMANYPDKYTCIKN